LGSAIQAAAAANTANGQPGTLRELAAKLVTLDESTRATPDATRQALYKDLLAKQTALTRTLHAAKQL